MYQKIIQTIASQRAFVIICSFLALLIFVPSAASAQPWAADVNFTACDPEIMDAMEARAWMEAQREITQNKNLIYKPDSVLQYSCFDKMLEHFARDGNSFFSEEGNSRALDSAFSATAGIEMGIYLEQNYPHNYLANRFQPEPSDEYEMATFNNNTYFCNQMSRVWTDSYMDIFISDKSRDGFYDFAYYQTNPIINVSDFVGSDSSTQSAREAFMNQYETDLDTAFSSASNAAYGIQAGIDGAQADTSVNHVLQDINEKGAAMFDNDGYLQDPLVTHLDKILPVASGSGNCPGAAIPTGVQLRTAAGIQNEYVCPNPGCAVTYSDSGAATCTPTPAP